jgi:hypothetical protein
MSRLCLFHGTSSKLLKRIMAKGLVPRQVSGVAVYDGELTSSPDRIYLTDTYALEFASIACKKLGGNILVARVFVDPAEVCPDTDFVDGGLHRMRFDDGIKCLESTGCSCIRRPIMPDKLYVIPKAVAKDRIPEGFRIETGLRHVALKKMRQDNLDLVLMSSKQYLLESNEWVER